MSENADPTAVPRAAGLPARAVMGPDNELYDAACDVLAAAQRLGRAARAEGVEPAVPATLGCLGATLGALTVGCATLGHNAGAAQRDTLDGLVHALRQAQRACDAARSSAAARVRAAPSGVPSGE